MSYLNCNKIYKSIINIWSHSAANHPSTVYFNASTKTICGLPIFNIILLSESNETSQSDIYSQSKGRLNIVTEFQKSPQRNHSEPWGASQSRYQLYSL